MNALASSPSEGILDLSSEPVGDDFQPSLAILGVMKILDEQNATGRTRLAQSSKVHYRILSKHIRWLELKGYLRLQLEDGRAVVRLTREGKDFAKKLLSLYE